MKETITYLTFDGNCREAMTFYEKCTGGQLDLIKYADTPCEVPADSKDRIMHAHLGLNGKTMLMASDNPPGMPLHPGDNFSISVHCETQDETERLFNALSDQGKVTMPLQETFWAARFGMCTDRFGVNWMFNLPKPQ